MCTWGMAGWGGSMLPCTLKILPKSPKLPEVISHVLPYYYPLAQQSCGGDIGSVPYVCM